MLALTLAVADAFLSLSFFCRGYSSPRRGCPRFWTCTCGYELLRVHPPKIPAPPTLVYFWENFKYPPGSDFVLFRGLGRWLRLVLQTCVPTCVPTISASIGTSGNYFKFHPPKILSPPPLSPPTLVYFGVNFKYPPESELLLFREMIKVGNADMCANNFCFNQHKRKLPKLLIGQPLSMFLSMFKISCSNIGIN